MAAWARMRSAGSPAWTLAICAAALLVYALPGLSTLLIYEHRVAMARAASCGGC